ncbi:hypothetical protein R1flu_014777 [Riccia fluitans]|uniref:Reverse transcriptase n=1 Tax=Riccia fluitans TaxID=41844 RepID=A0ABD1YH28_9MARC
MQENGRSEVTKNGLLKMRRRLGSFFCGTRFSGESVARGDVVGLLDRELSEIDRNRMSAVPDRDEIETVVFGMARYKALGQDGLTVDVVKECGEFVGEECVMMKANFDELLKILEKYELAFGAKVNIVKSLVMPLGSKKFSTWVGELLFGEKCEKIGAVLQAIFMGGKRTRDFKEAAYCLEKDGEAQRAGWVRIDGLQRPIECSTDATHDNNFGWEKC